MKKCAICGSKELKYIDYKTLKQVLGDYNTEKGKLLFELWHAELKECNNCGYASTDISASYNKEDLTKALKQLEDLKVDNIVRSYLLASILSESTNNVTTTAKLLLTTYDLLYSTAVNDFIQFGQDYDHDLKNFALTLKAKALLSLEEKTNKSTEDLLILYLFKTINNENCDNIKTLLNNIILDNKNLKIFKYISEIK